MPAQGVPGIAGFLGRVQDDEQTTDAEIQSGRWANGGCSEFRGNGMLVRRDRLEEVGGWRAETVCEDLDLASRLAAAHGIAVAWALDAVAWEEPVLDPGQLWRQRCRWAEGIVRRQLGLTWPILRSPKLTLRAKLDYLTYTSQTLAPISLLGAVLGGFLFRRWRAAVSLLGVYLAAGTVLSADSLRFSPDPDGQTPGWPRRLLRGFAVTLFSAHWLLVFPVGWGRIALSRGPVRFDKTDHSGAPRGWRPPTVAQDPDPDRGDEAAVEAAPVPMRRDGPADASRRIPDGGRGDASGEVPHVERGDGFRPLDVEVPGAAGVS